METSSRISRRKGGKAENKIAKVMHEFKEGKLKSSSGEKVTDRQQAIAIGLSEARTIDPNYQMSKKWSGGEMAGGGNINGFFSNDGKTFINVAVGKSSPNRKGEVIKIEEKGGIKWATVKFRDFQEDIRFEDNSMKDGATVSPRKSRRMETGVAKYVILSDDSTTESPLYLGRSVGGKNIQWVEKWKKPMVFLSHKEAQDMLNKSGFKGEVIPKSGGSPMVKGGVMEIKNYYLPRKNKDRLKEELDYEENNLKILLDMKDQSPIIKKDIEQTEHTITRIKERLNKKSSGGSMASGGLVGEKYYDKKEKMSLEVVKNYNGIYDVKWQDGKIIPYSETNVQFFIDKKIWTKIKNAGSTMATGGTVMTDVDIRLLPEIKIISHNYFGNNRPYELIVKTMSNPLAISRKEALQVGRFAEILQAKAGKLNNSKVAGWFSDFKGELLLDEKFHNGGGAKDYVISELSTRIGIGKEAINTWLDKNNLSKEDGLRILTGLGRKHLQVGDVSTAIIGDENNTYSKELIKYVKSDKAYSMATGGGVARKKMKDMISEIESGGDEISNYSVDESQSVSNAGDAVDYEYEGKKYTIITWNQMAMEHEQGEKTITDITDEDDDDEMKGGGRVGGVKLYRFKTSKEKSLTDMLTQSMDGLSRTIHKGYVVAIKKEDGFGEMRFVTSKPEKWAHKEGVMGYAPYPDNTKENVVIIDNKKSSGSSMKKGGQAKMLREKSFYQAIPVYKGFKWAGFWDGYHHFTAKEDKGWTETRATDQDIDDGNLKDMIDLGVTKGKGGKMNNAGKAGDELSNVYYLVLDKDERGEYGATVYHSSGKQVWDIDENGVIELQEDGFLKYKPHEDLERLSKYLSDMKVVPKHTNVLSEEYFNELKENPSDNEMKNAGRIPSEIDATISAKYNIVRYGNKGMEVQSKSGKKLKTFNDKPTDVENWQDAVKWAKQNKSKIKMEKAGQVDSAQLTEMANGYMSAVLFAENDDDDNPLERDYGTEDFAPETVSAINKMLGKFISDNKDVIEKSGMDNDQIGMDIWYAQAGHGVGFFDRGLDDDVEKKLTSSAKALARFPEIEIDSKNKIHVRGVEKYAGGGSTMASGDRMYNFLKDDLEKLEKAVSEGDKQEVERFFSYWGYHLKSLKMAQGGSAMEEAGQVPENLVEKLKDKYSAQIQDMGITEIFIDPFGEVHITSEHDIDPSWAEAIEADARAMSGSSEENASSNGSQNVATLISFANSNSKLSDEKAGIMSMADEMKWNSERLHQQFKRIFSYMAETSYNKENPDNKIELTEAERHEFADALAQVSNSKPQEPSSQEQPLEPNIKGALQNLTDANAKLNEAEAHADSTEDTIDEAKTNIDRAVDDLEGNKLPFKNGGGIPDNKRPDGFKRVSPAEKNQATYKGKTYNYNRGDGIWYPVFEGNIPNNYSGKTPKEVWNEWRVDQRLQFIVDHQNEIYNSKNVYVKPEHLERENFDKLPHTLIDALELHVRGGQYKNAGKIPNNYEGKTPDKVWNDWNKIQRAHFIADHRQDIGFLKQETQYAKHYMDWTNEDYKKFVKDIEKWTQLNYIQLPTDLTIVINEHVNKGQYAGGGKATDLSIGTIYKLKNGAIYTVISHRTVIDTSLSYESDAKGNPVKGGRIISSNSWLGETPEVIGKTELDSVSKNIGGHTYTYYLSGDKTVDTEMSHLDERWKAFAEHAGKKLRAQYDEQEEHNNHYANAKMVNDWFNDHKSEGGSSYAQAGKVGGSGWGKFKKGERIANFENVKVGDILLEHSNQFNADNIVLITEIPKGVPNDKGKIEIIHGKFVDPQNISKLRRGANEEGFAIWDFKLKYEDFYLPKSSKKADGGSSYDNGGEILQEGMTVKNKNTGEVVKATKERFGSRSFTDRGFFKVIHPEWEITTSQPQPQTSNLKPVRMSPEKKKLEEKIKKLERALAGDKMSAKAKGKLEKQLEEYKAKFNRRIPVYERMMESKGKFHIEIPAEYRLKMNTLLHGTDLKPRLNELEGKLRITVDNKAKLNRLYKIYSDMLTKKKQAVPSLDEISGKPSKVKMQK